MHRQLVLLLALVVLLTLAVPTPWAAAVDDDGSEFQASGGSVSCMLFTQRSWVNLAGDGWTLARSAQEDCFGVAAYIALSVSIQKPNGTYTSSNFKFCYVCVQRQITTKEGNIKPGAERIVTATGVVTLAEGVWEVVAPGCIGLGSPTAICTDSKHVYAPS